MQKNNAILIIRSLLLLIVLLVVSSYLFYLPYKVVRKSTIDSLNAQQMVLAKQSAQGVQAFFHHYDKILNYLGQQQNIIHLNAEGKRLIDNQYQINNNELLALTRVDAKGRITYTVPFNKESIGKDISQQPHNAFIIKHHQPVVSDAFMSVQGYPAVAYSSPIFNGDDYTGSLTILIPFDVIAKKHLAVVDLGEGGYAWMLDRSGVELYCTVPGHTGQNVHETSSQFPTIIDMAEKMMSGKQGVTSYTYDRMRGEQTGQIIKQAVYYPVVLPNNTWSIVVATPEILALAAVREFVQWWISIFVIFIFGVSIYVFFLMRSRFVTREDMKKQLIEQKLYESERLFRQIVSNAHVPMIIVNFKGDIEHVNHKCVELYGYSQENISTVDKWFEQAYPDSLLRKGLYSQWQKELHQATLTNDVSALSNFELEIVCKDGNKKQVYFEYTLIEERVLITITDLTEQRNIEAERERIQERENRAKKIEVVGLMAGSVAHDLNNILAGVVSYPDLLLSKLPGESPLRKPLQSIKESGIRAATVVEDLLTAARGAAISREPNNLNTLIEEYLSSPEHQRLKALHPMVEFEWVSKAERAGILCSPVHIKKSIMNLVANSAESINDKGLVSLSSRTMKDETDNDMQISPREYVELVIKDNGCGMSNEETDQIFEPFYTKKIMGRSGSGLGLTIVWNTVQNHDGTITVYSGPDGTTFTLLFPLSNDTEDIERAKESDGESLHGKSEHLLVVDDEPVLREIACQLLSQHGYIVDAVTSGEEAIEFVRENPVDLILLDMIMEPGINGRETYTKILEINPQQKAIIVSGYSVGLEVEKVIQLGSGKLLKKPYSSKNLLLAVKAELIN